jgi:hypothetical protein
MKYVFIFLVYLLAALIAAVFLSDFTEAPNVLIDKGVCYRYTETSNNNCHLDMWQAVRGE